MLLCQALRPRADAHTRPVACAIGCAHVVPALCRTKTPPLLISWLYHCGFATRCLRFVPASRLTTQDSLTVAGQAFRAGVVTRRVWIESFDRFVHFVHFVISSARLCLLMLLLLLFLAISQLTELGWRQHNKVPKLLPGYTMSLCVIYFSLSHKIQPPVGRREPASLEASLFIRR